MQLACFSVCGWGLNSYETVAFHLAILGQEQPEVLLLCLSSAWPGAGLWGNTRTSWGCRTCLWCPGSAGLCCGMWQCLSPAWIAPGAAACPEGAGRLGSAVVARPCLSLLVLWLLGALHTVLLSSEAACSAVGVSRMVTVCLRCLSSARLLRAQGGL